MSGLTHNKFKQNPFTKNVSITLDANNTTKSHTLWTLTGSVKVIGLYGIVTTALGSNVTAAHWRMNDGTNTPAITLATGTTLSSAPIGTLISKNAQVDVALISSTSAQVRVVESAVDNTPSLNEFQLVAKDGATNVLEFRYSTTDAPTSGVIQFFVIYVPLSGGGALT